jgi:hypothetical protein
LHVNPTMRESRSACESDFRGARFRARQRPRDDRIGARAYDTGAEGQTA